ncbi:type III pantothenate kinase [Ginsengibacter hankyongi]|uniref:Type III pantothenate kinase n=1 Tax=Ginsengibacter hankyongi TaxID=2607284 RepID=A0A5J5IJ22_9BACT|nr:type III pantothenate kinase [Ginsengibacter hankyongi]KAA9039528.1 type III pantothenate kinase [Ginsengibacter hankyongi]
MNTTLCFDFGNTRLKCGVFKNDQLAEVFSLADSNNSTIEELLKKYFPEKTILSSVIDHNIEMERILAEKSSFHKLSSQSILPFTTPVGKPETIGADRLALAAAAVYFHPGKNNLVIGLGSCVTYNFINNYNSFIGGSISPGMEMRFKSLNSYTAKLPLIKPDWNFPLIGYDTRTNILSGILMGLAVEIDGIIDKYRDKFNNFNVLLTGGDTLYFAHLIKNKIFADPDLIFKGLYAISETNYTKT